MIIIKVPNTQPQSEIGQAFAQESTPFTTPEAPLEPICLCALGLEACDYTEKAFYNGANKYQNDYTSLFINKEDSTDLIVFTLIDLITGNETILSSGNASTYGVYSEDDNHVGVEIDFNTLKTNYPDLKKIKFKKEQTVFGTPLSSETHTFSLLPFSIYQADQTVRIESVTSGLIESGNDYETLGWRNSVRIQGIVRRDYGTETDRILDEDRRLVQIQDKVNREYSLYTTLLPQSIYEALIEDKMLGNKLIVSDYNIHNANYKGLSLSPTANGIDNTHYEGNQNMSFVLKFTDEAQNIIKRNK